MASPHELRSRIKQFFAFSTQEVWGLVVAILFTAFIFSFRDWGVDKFDLGIGLGHLIMMILIAGFSFFFRIACQKIYGLSQGYLVNFKIWWTGLFVMLAIGFVSVGNIPLILIGGFVASMMVKQRLGEFRYGFDFAQNSVIGLWGVWGNLIAATLFGIGWMAFPQSYVFGKGVTLNLIMAACSLIPLPQLDGLSIFWGSRLNWVMGILTVAVAAILLMSRSKPGLIIAIAGATAAGFIYIFTGSEK